MAYVSKKYCLDTMRKNSAKYWKLYDSGNSCIGEMNDPDKNLDDSLDELTEALDDVSGGWVEVRANTKKGKEVAEGGDIKSGAYRFRISVSGGDPDRSKDRGSSGSHTALEKMYELKMEFELYKLKTEYEEKMKKEGGDPYEKFLDKIGNIVEMEYMEERKLTRTGIGAVEKKESLPAKEQINKGSNKEKVVEALTKLAEVDPNTADSLLKLAAFAKKNPDQYKQYLEML